MIVDFGGRGVLSSARRHVGVGREGSQVGEAASLRAATLMLKKQGNLLLFRFPGRHRVVWQWWFGSGRVCGGYVVQCLFEHSSPRHMGTRAGGGLVGPAIARHILIWVCASWGHSAESADRGWQQGGVGSSSNWSLVSSSCRTMMAMPKNFRQARVHEARASPMHATATSCQLRLQQPHEVPHIHNHNGRRRKDPVRYQTAPLNAAPTLSIEQIP